MSRVNYFKSIQRGKITIVRRGGGASCPALVSFDSLSDALQAKVRAKYPDMEERRERESNPAYELFMRAYERDYKALSYYLTRLLELNTSLSKVRLEELANEYTTNASVIQAVQKLRRDNQLYRKVRGRGALAWSEMAEAIRFFQGELGHTLGLSPKRFASWVRKYELEGYDALISKKFGNSNTRKVDAKTEQLLLQLACDKHRPHHHTVWQWYCDFLAGKTSYINKATGEIYDSQDFPDLSEKTVREVLSSVLNQARLSKHHDARHDYQTQLRPYHKRTKPRYSLSMVSFDDKDFSVKIRWRKGVKKRVRGVEKMQYTWIETSLKAYLCYDVASQAIIGYAFSGEKNRDIFEACLRSMYRRLLSWGLGQTYEAQVENHLVSLYKDTTMQSGRLFPEVTFAGAENSQEKYAERYNETLKYQFEKYAISEAVGRPHARLRANRTKNRRVSDESNENYLQGEYSFEEAVRAYQQIIEDYNNAPHPDKKLYPNKTRLEVLLEYVHPEIQAINEVQLVRWAGWGVKTSITRGSFQARGERYSVAPELLDSLVGNTQVEAYWWEQEEGAEVEEMHLYQDDTYLGICPRIVPYQVSKLEKTRVDDHRLGIQQSRVRAWDKAVEAFDDEELIQLSTEQRRALELEPIRVVAMPLEGDKELEEEAELTEWQNRTQEYATRAFADL